MQESNRRGITTALACIEGAVLAVEGVILAVDVRRIVTALSATAPTQRAFQLGYAVGQGDLVDHAAGVEGDDEEEADRLIRLDTAARSRVEYDDSPRRVGL